MVEAIRLVLDAVCVLQTPLIDAVGYRVVHPGAKLATSIRGLQRGGIERS